MVTPSKEKARLDAAKAAAAAAAKPAAQQTLNVYGAPKPTQTSKPAAESFVPSPSTRTPVVAAKSVVTTKSSGSAKTTTSP